MSITESTGYKKLLAAVERDEKDDTDRGRRFFHDYRGKLAWVLARAQHYADRTGLSAAAILDAWEERRNYWYMNYYQDANQAEIKDGKVRVFDTSEEMLASIGKPEFRCPACGGVSKSPYECTTGLPLKGSNSGKCDWKVYGLFGHLGKGVTVFVKEKVRGETIFMPIAWEEKS